MPPITERIPGRLSLLRLWNAKRGSISAVVCPKEAILLLLHRAGSEALCAERIRLDIAIFYYSVRLSGIPRQLGQLENASGRSSLT